MRLLLIRHGEIDYNRQARYCGITDAPLNQNGIKQVHRLKLLLANEKVDRIYSSPLRRARKTARIVFGNKRIIIKPELQEIDFGKLECLSVQEVKFKFPRFYRQWLKDIEKAKPPCGETVAHCRNRIWEFIQSLIRNKSNNDKTIAIVMHGGPIKLLISKIFKLGINGFWLFHPEPASATTVEHDKGRFCLLARNYYYEKDYPGFGWRP